jgi:hypothetical protein
MATPRQCKAKTKSGAQCAAYAVKGSRFCLTHAPERARERAKRNKRGGEARRAIPKVSEGIDAPRIANVGDVLGLVNWVIADTWHLENSAPRSRALLAAADQAVKVLQIGELEDRVRALWARWWWFVIVLGLLVLVEIGERAGIIPSGGRLCPWWVIGC